MGFMPFPCGSDNILQIVVFRRPTQHILGLLGGGDQDGRIACAAAFHLHGDGMSGCLAGSLDNCIDGIAGAAAQVEYVAFAAFTQILHCLQVGIRQIRHMQVIPDAGAVLGGIVVTIDGDKRPFAQGYLENHGNQVGFRIMVLADFSALMGAAGVEITQRYIFNIMGHIEPFHHFFHGQLGFAVGVGREGAVGLENRHILRLAVGGCSGGEDDFAHAVFVHFFEQAQGAVHIVVVVLGRSLHALAHQGVGGKMNHCVNGIFLKHGIQKILVPDVAHIQLAAQNRIPVPLVQIIDDYNFLACRDQLRHCMGTDITCSSCYQYCHVETLLFSI
ncbi:hypothetical protein D3C75_754120 [compost metagenome]